MRKSASAYFHPSNAVTYLSLLAGLLAVVTAKEWRSWAAARGGPPPPPPGRPPRRPGAPPLPPGAAPPPRRGGAGGPGAAAARRRGAVGRALPPRGWP